MSPRSQALPKPPWRILVGVLVGALLLGAVAWLALGDTRRGGRPPSAPRTGSAPAVAGAQPAPPSPLDPAAAPPASLEAERELFLASSPGVSGGPAPIEAVPSDGISVRVVTGDASTPVPGAVVGFVDERSIVDEDMLAVRAGTLSLDQILDRIGRRFRADGAGLVRVPAPRGFGFVAGGTDELWGMLEFPENAIAPVLVLASDPPLLARVVDGEGNPVGGVPVALRQRYDGFVQDLFAVESERGTGLATLRHVRRFVIEKKRDGEPLVALAVLAGSPIERALDPEDLPTRPVELVLPPTGSVELTIEDARGKRFREPVVVRMIRTPRGASTERAFERAERLQRVADGGRLVVPHVGLGLDLTIRLEADGFLPVTFTHAGPRSAGERVEIRRGITRAVPVIVGLAVGPDGQPFAGKRIETRVTAETPEDKDSVTHARTRTDAAGRFRQALPATWVEWNGPLFLELEAEDALGSPLSARIPLPGIPAVGENDLGIVTLAPLPLIASGEVVEPDGTPVSGAQVVLETPLPGSGDAPVRWRSVWDLRTRSGGEGRFELRGDVDHALVRLSATHPDHVGSERVEVAPGTGDVRLVLAPAGRIAGSLLIDEGFPRELFVIRGLREPQPGPSYLTELQADGSFLLTGLLEGTYRVTVGLRDEESCGEEFPDVAVEPARTTEDERLEGIDLRDRLRSFSIEVVDEAGAPIGQGVISRRVAGAAEFEAGRTWLRGGRADIATCLPAIDLEIDVPGYRTVLLESVSEDQRVTMLPGPRLRFTIANAPELEPGRTLGIQIRRSEGGRWKPTATVWFERGDSVEVEAKGPGRHEVYVMLMERTKDGRRSQQLSAGAETTIEVAETGGLQTFEIELSEATLRRTEP